MSNSPPPAVNGHKGSAGPPGPRPAAPPSNPWVFASRCLVSAVLLAVYFAGYDALIGPFGRTMLAKVSAVTLLAVLLVAVWWKTIKSDVRWYAPIFITYILAVSDAAYGILDNLH